VTDSVKPAALNPDEQVRHFVQQCTADEVEADVFEFVEPSDGHARAFGGLQMAQALAAAARTISATSV
jgi:acyl-CoA thioesterase